MQKNNLRNLPSIDTLLNDERSHPIIKHAGRDLAIRGFRNILSAFRHGYQEGDSIPDIPIIIRKTEQLVDDWLHPSLQPVVNATGIILHTNLGRAPLSADTIAAMNAVSNSFNNLEFNLNTGKRGKRETHPQQPLTNLTGAEAALIVNNNAAAVLLVLTALANRKKVAISHSQLVEIGGGFRVPDVMKQSGARLVSIGTTNRVHLEDYTNALQEDADFILCAHHSNYKIVGFTSEPNLDEIVAASHQFGKPVIYDLGSGAFLNTEEFGILHEPTVFDAVNSGADIICFSGDKLMGGPQAGIIIGKKRLIDKVRIHPLARAVRADKLCLAGITQTLNHYLRAEAIEKIPVWRMIAKQPEQLEQTALHWQSSIDQGKVIKNFSKIGGGSLPEEQLPTFTLQIDAKHPDAVLKKLRKLPIPIIARIENDQIVFDPRTILPAQEEYFLSQLKKVFAD